MKRLAVVVVTALAVVGLVSTAASAAPKKVPHAVVQSVVVSPKTLPASGGTVKLTVRAARATTCTVTITPRIPGFPRTFRCASGHLLTAVKVPKNSTPKGETLRFAVKANGPGGSSAPRAALVSEATDIGPLGATLQVHDENGDALSVTVTQVIDPAQGADEFTTPNAGDRFVAVVETLTNASTATISDDVNVDTALIGTDDQGYDVDFDQVSECTNFNDGAFTLLPGASETGCVVYQLPNGVNAKAIQFSLTENSVDTAQWNV